MEFDHITANGIKHLTENQLLKVAELHSDDNISTLAIRRLQKEFDPTFHFCPEWDYMVCTTKHCGDESHRPPARKIRIEFIFAWFDFWVGLYWDKKKKWLYILPIPMFGIIVKFNH